MNDDCARWILHSDARTLGSFVSEQHAEFCRAHEALCAECGAEAALWKSLRPACVHTLPNQAEVDRILELARSAPLEVDLADEVRKARGKRIASAAALLAVAAAVALWFGSVRSEAPNLARVARAPLQQASRAPLRPLTTAGPAPSVLTRPTRTYTRDECGEVTVGITLCAAAGTRLTLDLSTERRVVYLEQGRAIASLVPQPKGTTFSVTTRAGSVTAVGTKFMVEIDDAGQTYARVHHGKVMVSSTEQSRPRPLRAGQAVRLGAAAVERIPEAQRRVDLELLRAPHEASGAAESSLQRHRATARETDELAKARELRARGQFREAAAVYRRLSAENPNGASGRTALVSLGWLSLSSLGDPSGALAAFNGYLRAGDGALTKQALYGRLRALQALGRTSEARAATDTFLSRYPSAPESQVIRRKLSAESD